MTQETFWDRLAQLRGSFTLVEVGLGRGYIRTIHPRLICPVCPVCAVANLSLGENNYTLQYWDAADRISLNPYFARQVARAADDDGDDKIRDRLLTTLGLEETRGPHYDQD